MKIFAHFSKPKNSPGSVCQQINSDIEKRFQRDARKKGHKPSYK